MNNNIAFVSSVPETIISFMSKQLHELSKTYTTYVICSKSAHIDVNKSIPSVLYVDITISRRISLIVDIISLLKLIQFFYFHRLLLVQSITPKAGLLTMLAAWICRIPIRIHVFTGQVWITKKGFSRWYLKNFDRLIAKLATSLLTDSPSQKQILVSEGIVSESDITVIADGSICGVDTFRFRQNEDIRLKLRAKYSIPKDATVALFMGRLKKDKGVLDLARAYGELDAEITNLFMFFVGPDEDGLINKIYQFCSFRNNQIRFIDYVNNPEDFFAASDFLCLPSYREGFGLVIVEAGAVGIPTLASSIYGITDAIVDGVTGVLHQPGDICGISRGLLDMAIDSSKRKAMGIAARIRVLNLFSSSRVVEAQIQYYQLCIQKFRSHG